MINRKGASAPGRSGLQSMLDNGRLTWSLLRDDRVPTLLKVVIPLAVAVYIISPVDIIPDFIPVVGELDDLGVVLLGMTIFINLAPRAVVNEHRANIGLPPMPGRADANSRASEDLETRIIDGTYKNKDGT